MLYNNKRAFTSEDRNTMISTFSVRRLKRRKEKAEKARQVEKKDWIQICKKLYAKLRYGNDLNHFIAMNKKHLQL